MGKRTTTKGYWRAQGATSSSSSRLTGPSPGVLAITLAVVVDAAAADGTETGKYLPLGAIPLRVDVVSGHTGGTAPLLNIGLSDGTTPDPDSLVDGVAADADTSTGIGAGATAGVQMGVALTSDLQVVAGTGGGTAGTGTSIAYITYTMEDDGAIND